MLKNILHFGTTLSKKEQKFITGGGTSFIHADNGDKQLGEGCVVGSTLPHLSCGPGLTCILGISGTRTGLCAVQL